MFRTSGLVEVASQPTFTLNVLFAGEHELIKLIAQLPDLEKILEEEIIMTVLNIFYRQHYNKHVSLILACPSGRLYLSANDLSLAPYEGVPMLEALTRSSRTPSDRR